MIYLLKIAQQQDNIASRARVSWADEQIDKVIKFLERFHRYLSYTYPVAGALTMRGLVGPRILMPTRWQMLRGAQPIFKYPVWPLIAGAIAGTLAIPDVRKYLMGLIRKKSSPQSEQLEKGGRSKKEPFTEPLITYLYPPLHIGFRAGLGALIARGLTTPQVIPTRTGIERTFALRYRKLPLILGAVIGALSSPYAYFAIHKLISKLRAT